MTLRTVNRRRIPREVTAVVLLLIAVFLTRWPLAPKYLFFFDSANFAYAMEHFNPAAHQPQLPGYPLFVLLMQLLHSFIPNPQHVLVASGILGTVAAAWCLWRLGVEMFGCVAGGAAAALLIANPVMWFGGLTNQVRIFLAVCGCVMALLFWRASHPDAPPRKLYVASILSGIMAGFRPETLLLVVPLLVAALIRRRTSVRQAAAGIAALGAGAAVWLIPTVMWVGGPQAYANLLLDYARDQFHQSSPFFGAHAQGALKMAWSALVWNGLAAIAWLWFLPFAALGREKFRAEAGFIAIWFVPGFLFQAVVHVADPDQTLFTVPALCLTGGAILASARRGAKWRIAAAIAVSAFLFFRPPAGVAAASGYHVVRWSSGQTAETVDGLRKLTQNGPAEVILAGQTASWRQLAYYFPEQRMLVVEPDGKVWELEGTRQFDPVVSKGDYVLSPGLRTIVALDPTASATWMRLENEAGFHSRGTLLYRDFGDDASFQITGAHFVFR